jgi:hypothetical protein
MRSNNQPSSVTRSVAAQLLEIGVLASLGSIVSVLPIVFFGAPGTFGLRRALANSWAFGNGVWAILFGAPWFLVRGNSRVTSEPGRLAALVTIGIAAVGVGVGLTQVMDPNLSGPSFAPTVAGHVAVAASVLAVLLVLAASAPRRPRIASWRVATEVAAAANVVLVLDGLNILHTFNPDMRALTASAAAAIVAIVALTYTAIKQLPIEPTRADPSEPETPA